MEPRVVRGALTAAGVVLVGLGAVGIFLPVLPTTPFLLLAAACFVRGSPRLHRWLLSHRRLGPYVSGFVEGGGMPARAKRVSMLTLWIAIGLSAALVLWQAGPTTAALVTVGVLLLVAILVTRYIRRRPTTPA
jgi:hypothetical protein